MKRGIEAQTAAMAAELSGGSVGRALLLAQGPALELRRKIQTLPQALPVKDAARIWQLAPWLKQVKMEEGTALYTGHDGFVPGSSLFRRL